MVIVIALFIILSLHDDSNKHYFLVSTDSLLTINSMKVDPNTEDSLLALPQTL